MSLLQDLADGGIRFEILCGAKARWSATIYEVNHLIDARGAAWPVVSAGGLTSYAEAEAWLAANAAARFPESGFAQQRSDDRAQKSEGAP